MTAFSVDRDTTNPGIYLGQVTSVDGSTAYVKVPRLADDYAYPARYGVGLVPAAGDDVAVGFLEGDRDELVILIRLA